MGGRMEFQWEKMKYLREWEINGEWVYRNSTTVIGLS
jgi:hypothetical protein